MSPTTISRTFLARRLAAHGGFGSTLSARTQKRLTRADLEEAKQQHGPLTAKERALLAPVEAALQGEPLTARAVEAFERQAQVAPSNRVVLAPPASFNAEGNARIARGGAATGNETAWQAPEGRFNHVPMAMSANGRQLYSAEIGALRRRAADTGGVEWSCELPADVTFETPAVSAAGSRVILSGFNAQRGMILGVDQDTGQQVWSHQLPSNRPPGNCQSIDEMALTVAPAITPDGLTALMLDPCAKELRAYNARDGAELWKAPLPPLGETVQQNALTVSPDGKTVACGVHAPDNENTLAVYDVDTGTERWRRTFSGGPNVIHTPAFSPAGDALYTHVGGEVVGLAARDGEPLWKAELRPFLNNRTTVVPSPDGRFVAAQGAREIQLLDAESGEVRWSRNDVTTSTPAFSAHGEALIHQDYKGRFWRVETETSEAEKVAETASGDSQPALFVLSPDARYAYQSDRWGLWAVPLKE
jgi:outer membrane protein assembly factor BamB